MYIPLWVLIIILAISGFGGFMFAAMLSSGKEYDSYSEGYAAGFAKGRGGGKLNEEE